MDLLDHVDQGDFQVQRVLRAPRVSLAELVVLDQLAPLEIQDLKGELVTKVQLAQLEKRVSLLLLQTQEIPFQALLVLQVSQDEMAFQERQVKRGRKVNKDQEVKQVELVLKDVVDFPESLAPLDLGELMANLDHQGPQVERVRLV